MSKWGDRKVNGAEKIITPKIYPVPAFLDMVRIRKVFRALWIWLNE